MQIKIYFIGVTNLVCHSERSEESPLKCTIKPTEILRRYTPQNDLFFIIASQTLNYEFRITHYELSLQTPI